VHGERRLLLGQLRAGRVSASIVYERQPSLHVERPGLIFNSLASGLTLLLGIVVVLLYALIRTRLGPGPKTALMAAALAWFCIYFYSGVLTSVLLGLRKDLLLIGLVWGAFEYSIAAIGGAALYREK